MATYKDYLGSSYHYDELVKRLKSGEATLKTSETKSGSISQDEYGQYVWVPDGGGFAEAIPASDLNKYYDSETGQYRLTKQVPVSPYIDLGKNPMMGGITEWPVQDLGNGNYQLSVMNSGENGYSNLVFKSDSAGKPVLPETAPAFFQPYDSGNFFSDVTGEALNLATSDAGKMLALAAGAGVFSPAAAGAGALTGTDAALADLAASTPAFTGAPAGAITAAGAGGLMTNAALDAQFIAADAAQLAGQGLSSGQIAQTLAASGVDSFVAADVAQLAAQGLGASQIASTLGASLPAGTAATGAGGLFTEGGLAAGGAAAGAAAAGAAGAGAGAAAAGGLTASQLATAGLISGGLNLAGGLLQGETTKDAMNQLAAQQAALAEKTLQMGKFQPVGVTTRFGTSAFTTDPVTGAITPSYTPSALATEYQNALAKLTTQGLTQGQTQQELAAQYLASQQGQPIQNLGSQYMASQAGQPLINKGLLGIESAIGQPLTAAGLQDLRSNVGQPLTTLGQQYMGESPEAIRQRYVEQQIALLAPQQEQTLAAIRARQAATGRGGLATGATAAGGLAATNPEMAAYYNSLANQQRQIAAGADTAAQQQAQFGANLYGTGTGLTQQARQQAAGLFGQGINLTQAGQQQAANQYLAGQGLTQAQQALGAQLYGTGLGLTQQGIQFGQQLGATAFNPFIAGFDAQKSVELAAQQPLELSTNFANTVATRGAAQGANYATAMAPSLQAQYNANNYNPLATTLQGAASNPLTGYGLMKLTGLA